MANNFPTYIQWQARVAAQIRGDFPDALPDNLADAIRLQTEKRDYLRYIGRLLETVPAPLSVMDTLTDDDLYALKKQFAPRGSVDWYVPARHRANKQDYL